MEIEQKMDKIVKRLKVTKEKNLELHIVIFEIDYLGEGLQSVSCAEWKTIIEHEDLLLRADADIRQQRLEIQILKVEQLSMEERVKVIERTMQEQKNEIISYKLNIFITKIE